ncbi:MAG: multiprotein-bridging factor 1 family protein [Candidatus Aenigmatarchaeota archaeon]
MFFISECNICGRKEATLKIKVEDAIVEVCKNCSCYGQVVHEKLVEKPKKVTSKEEEFELVENFGKIIKEARERMKLTRKEFAEKIKIKENILKRIESESLKPDEKLARIIEKELEIKILFKMEKEFVKRNQKTAPLTIGDVVEIE